MILRAPTPEKIRAAADYLLGDDDAEYAVFFGPQEDAPAKIGLSPHDTTQAAAKEFRTWFGANLLLVKVYTDTVLDNPEPFLSKGKYLVVDYKPQRKGMFFFWEPEIPGEPDREGLILFAIRLPNNPE